jgi:hypothetical protein
MLELEKFVPGRTIDTRDRRAVDVETVQKVPFGKPVAEPTSDAIQARRTMAIDYKTSRRPQPKSVAGVIGC